MKNILLVLVSCMSLLCSCDTGSKRLPTGIWRASLVTENKIEIPFNFELKEANGQYKIDILNADDRYEVDNISIIGDSVKVVMPLFGGQFNWKLEQGVLKGSFGKAGSYEMPCTATPNTKYRFFEKEGNPAFDVTGKWAVTISDMPAVGEWQQHGSRVTGSILTASGDYRFLEGTVTSDSMLYLSGFDGGFVLLFAAKLSDSNTLISGNLYSGFNKKYNFAAVRSESASLPDAMKITSMREGEDRLAFSFPNLDGQMVSLTDDKFKNKVTVVQFSGSWCPNCLDETTFFSNFYNANRDKLEIVCLAFERARDFESAKAAAEKLAKRCNVQYDVLITGIQPKPAEIMEALPMLVNFSVFPTSVIIDKAGKVRYIHAGFSGPGTGKYFDAYVDEFTKMINELAAE